MRGKSRPAGLARLSAFARPAVGASSPTAKRSIALLLMCLGVLLVAPVMARADTGNIIEPNTEPPNAANGWQAATCKTDEPVGGEPKIHCSPQTAEAFYTLAGGHPPIGFTQYIIKHKSGEGKVEPAGIPVPTAEVEDPAGDQSIKTLRVDLPPGLTVNPNATPKCSLAEFENKVGEFHVPACKEGTIVGREEITLVTTIAGVPAPSPPFPAGNTLPKGFIIPPSAASGTKIPVYNLQPKPGEPALFGFVAAGKEVVFLETEVSWENDFHESFTIKLPNQAPPFATLISRLVNFGQEAGNTGLVEEGDGTYINNPTTCLEPEQFPTLYSTWFRAHSYGEEDSNFPFGSTPFEAKVESSTGELIQQEGCETVPFESAVEVEPGTDEIDSPAGATVNTTLEYFTGEESEQQESHLRMAAETLPEGMGLNPSAAQGLQACSDKQFNKGARTYENECPASSKVGSVEIESPPLERALTGDVYVGEPKSRDPQSGEEFRILVEAKEEEEGLDARLVGNVKANPSTGQLTAIFNEQEVGELAGELPEGLPQVPFTSVRIHFDKAKAVLTSPPTCSPATTTGEMTPWARPDETVKISSEPFTLSTDPNGGSCPKTLAERKFDPGFKAGTINPQAGAYSPFELHLTRSDGQQEFRKIDVTLPPGMAAKLAGVSYCPEASITAAATKSGNEELTAPSCPASSQVGDVTIKSGSGAAPFVDDNGKAYFAGPYKGAPVSLVFIVPAVAGPYDLGTDVVRTALNVEPETTVVHAVSDEVPFMLGGVKLDIRSIDVNLNRSSYVINPTNCSPFGVIGAISGGGGNPNDPAAWATVTKNSPFTATDCNALKFKPKFSAKILGGKRATKRRQHPKLQAILQGRTGDANVARAAFTLPKTTILDQSNIKTICTRVQLSSSTCPKGSVYGHAKATSPLIEGPLKGPVYLTSSSNKLPDLLVDLQGQVNVRLRGVILSKGGKLKTVFRTVPDQPIKKFTLEMNGGKKGLLINTSSLCDKPQKAQLNLKAQNGKQLKNNKLQIKTPCKGKKKKGKK